MADGNKVETVSRAEGTPVQTSTSFTATTVVPAANPLMEPKNYMELGGFILMVAALFALIEKRMEKRRKDDQELHKLSHTAVDKEIGDVRHEVRNLKSRTDQLERQDRDHDIRLAKVEQAMESFKEGQQRMETTIKENHREQMDTTKTLFDQISTSIREVRTVSAKP